MEFNKETFERVRSEAKLSTFAVRCKQAGLHSSADYLEYNVDWDNLVGVLFSFKEEYLTQPVSVLRVEKFINGGATVYVLTVPPLLMYEEVYKYLNSNWELVDVFETTDVDALLNCFEI